MSQTKANNLHFAALLAVFLLALSLRLWSISFGLPNLYHADEPIIVNHALAYGTGDFNPHFFKIPPLTSYLAFFMYGIWYLIGNISGIFKNTHDFSALFFSNPSSFYLIARIFLGALPGAATVWVLYGIIQKHFSSQTASFAALLLAVNFLHVSDSHYVYADIPLVLCMTWGMGIIWSLFDDYSPSSLKHGLCALAIGLSAAIKYNGVFLAIPYIVTVFMLQIPATAKVKFLAKSAFVSCLVFLILNPWIVLDTPTFFAELKAQAAAQSGVYDWYYHIRRSLIHGISLPILGLTFGGLILSLMNKNSNPASKKKFAAACFLLVYYAVLIRWAQPYPRYVLPLIPLCCFFAADFIHSHKLWGSRPLAKNVVLGMFLFGIFLNLSKSIKFDKIMGEEDTRTLAQEWITRNVPVNSGIALEVDFAMPKLPFTKDMLLEKLQVSRHSRSASQSQIARLEFLLSQNQNLGFRLYSLSDQQQLQSSEFLMDKEKIDYDFEALRAREVQYVLIARLWERDIHQNFYDQLKSRGELIAAFNPYNNSASAWALDHPLTGGPFLNQDIMMRKRNGQPLYLYRLRS